MVTTQVKWHQVAAWHTRKVSANSFCSRETLQWNTFTLQSMGELRVQPDDFAITHYMNTSRQQEILLFKCKFPVQHKLTKSSWSVKSPRIFPVFLQPFTVFAKWIVSSTLRFECFQIVAPEACNKVLSFPSNFCRSAPWGPICRHRECRGGAIGRERQLRSLWMELWGIRLINGPMDGQLGKESHGMSPRWTFFFAEN